MFTPAEEHNLRDAARKLGLLRATARHVLPIAAGGGAARAHGGDLATSEPPVEELCTRLGEFMFEALRRSRGDMPAEDREDAVQEALVVGWQRLLGGGLDDPSRLGGFLHGVAEHKRHHGQRRRRAHELVGAPAEEAAAADPLDRDQPLPGRAQPGDEVPGRGGLDLEGARRHLELLLGALEEDERRIIRLTALGWPLQRIAAELGEPAEKVRSRRRRAQAKLRAVAQERGLHLAALLTLLQLLGGPTEGQGPAPEPKAPAPGAPRGTPPRAALLGAAVGALVLVGGLLGGLAGGGAGAGAAGTPPPEAAQPGPLALSETRPPTPEATPLPAPPSASSWPGEVRDIRELPRAAAYGFGWYIGGTSRRTPDAGGASANWLPWPGRETLLVCDPGKPATTMDGEMWCYIPTGKLVSSERTGWRARWGRAGDLQVTLRWDEAIDDHDHLSDCDPSWRRRAAMTIHNPSPTDTAAPAFVYVDLPGIGPTRVRGQSRDQLGTNVNTWLLPPGTSRSTTVWAAACGPPPTSWPTRGYVEDLTADLNRTAREHHLVPAECRLPRLLPDDLEQCRPR